VQRDGEHFRKILGKFENVLRRCSISDTHRLPSPTLDCFNTSTCATMDAAGLSSTDSVNGLAIETLSPAAESSAGASSNSPIVEPSDHATVPLPLGPPRPPPVPTLTELCIDAISTEFEPVFRLPSALHLEEIPERAFASHNCSRVISSDLICCSALFGEFDSFLSQI
jgi:hypothetical protein